MRYHCEADMLRRSLTTMQDVTMLQVSVEHGVWDYFRLSAV